ncbi:phospholipid scramblase 1-like isoform X2 [Leucoraja erinacea]|uniref:phospholipid scramblase 1-like isoform X2 n=2 Tax=Leucoraja erinaceus TaxID=7782 RepID=UPI0024567D0B|nr:phospholipid scramblase 1-like isoform X2 [Leucoraja erinacea]XP_055493319.1 phospholipid scramblase 1-like isoform X2 [Leucoraja erinacea]
MKLHQSVLLDHILLKGPVLLPTLLGQFFTHQIIMKLHQPALLLIMMIKERWNPQWPIVGCGKDTYVPERSPAFYQQMQVAWMQAPAPIPNCPPGLEYLTMIDQIFVYQLFEFIEALTGFETKNKYELKNSMGQRVYFAVEESEFCNRLCCGANRAFSIKIMDNLNQTVLNLVRPLGCHSCWCPCLHHRMEVQAPPGTIIGYVVQEWNPCIPILSIQNEMSETILKIRGPCMQFSCCGDVNFKVLSKDESTVVGKISKKWTGLLREFFTDADNFGIQFPMDLDVKVKAVLIGACIMVDFFVL